jgi:hypothetical protein
MTGIDRTTIRRYEPLYRAQAAQASNSSEVATDFRSGDRCPHRACPAHARSAWEPYRAWIEEQVRLQRNATAIYQDLVDRFGFSARYNTVKRFVRTLRRVDSEQFDRPGVCVRRSKRGRWGGE